MLKISAGMAPLTRNRSTKTVPNDIMKEYYVQRAAGGAGLIVSEGTLIIRQGCFQHSRFLSCAKGLNWQDRMARGSGNLG